MHELSLMENIVQIVEEAAIKDKFTRVNTLWLEIGQLASVEKTALVFAFEVVSQSSLLNGARLEIVEKMGQAWCLTCHQTVLHESLETPCPLCGHHQLQVTGGDQMRVIELEVS